MKILTASIAAGLIALSLPAFAASATTTTDRIQLAQRSENPGGGMFRNENPGGGMFRNENPGGGMYKKKSKKKAKK